MLRILTANNGLLAHCEPVQSPWSALPRGTATWPMQPGVKRAVIASQMRLCSYGTARLSSSRGCQTDDERYRVWNVLVVMRVS